MAAHNLDFAPAARRAGRGTGLSRGAAAMGVLAVLEIAAVWQGFRSLRERYEDRQRILEHRLELATDALNRSHDQGFTAGVEACRAEIQASANDVNEAQLAAVLKLQPRRGVRSARVTPGRRLHPGA